jgi:hypothetical protein
MRPPGFAKSFHPLRRGRCHSTISSDWIFPKSLNAPENRSAEDQLSYRLAQKLTTNPFSSAVFRFLSSA